MQEMSKRELASVCQKELSHVQSQVDSAFVTPRLMAALSCVNEEGVSVGGAVRGDVGEIDPTTVDSEPLRQAVEVHVARPPDAFATAKPCHCSCWRHANFGCGFFPQVASRIGRYGSRTTDNYTLTDETSTIAQGSESDSGSESEEAVSPLPVSKWNKLQNAYSGGPKKLTSISEVIAEAKVAENSTQQAAQTPPARGVRSRRWSLVQLNAVAPDDETEAPAGGAAQVGMQPAPTSRRSSSRGATRRTTNQAANSRLSQVFVIRLQPNTEALLEEAALVLRLRCGWEEGNMLMVSDAVSRVQVPSAPSRDGQAANSGEAGQLKVTVATQEMELSRRELLDRKAQVRLMNG